MLVGVDVDGEKCYLEIKFNVTEQICKKKHSWKIKNAAVINIITEIDLLKMIKKELSNGHSLDAVFDAYGIIAQNHQEIEQHLTNN